MAIKLLENIGIENTGVGASALNNLITGNKSGIVGNYLNECAFTATGNTIIIDTGLLIICGRQVEIDAIESITLSSLPSEDVRYQIVIELVREESGEVTASIFARKPSTLIQENLLKDGFVYQFELGRVTHKTTGQVTEALRTADILYGQSGAGADIEVGEVNTQMISTELPAEVNINKTVDSGKTKLNFDFLLPKPYEDSVTGLVYSTQIAGNPVNIPNTNDGFVDKVKITNDTASAISSPLTGKSVGENLYNNLAENVYARNVNVLQNTANTLEIEATAQWSYSGTVYKWIYLPKGNVTMSGDWEFNIANFSRYNNGRITVGTGYDSENERLIEGAAGLFYFLAPSSQSGSFSVTREIPESGMYLFEFSISRLVGATAGDKAKYTNLRINVGGQDLGFTEFSQTDFSIPLKDTSGTVLDLNPADEIKLIDGKYHLNDTELHDDSQDALRAIPTKSGETNLIGDQPFTFDVTELAIGGEKKYVALKDQDGITVLPVTKAENTLMFDGRTVEQGLQELRKDIDNLNLIPYDIVIRTQAEFEALIKSPTWIDAQSVALVGQFVYDEPDNSGIKIPSTVKQIHGFNSAKITITNFVYNATTAKGGLWYDTLPTTPDYSICDLEVDCTGTGTGYGFRNCTNLTNCTGTGTGAGFRNCTNLTNCTGTGTGTYGYGFNSCINLTNCTGTGTGTYGYGFNSITYASNCKDGGSKVDMWYGTNKNINVETCRKTLVDADNTTLNT